MRLFIGATSMALCLTITIISAQRNPMVSRAELPVGLGIAIVTPRPGGVIEFYRPPTVGERPGDYPSSAAVRFGPGQPSVDIASAPPWLVPEHLKMDYEIFHLRALTISTDWVEVIGNTLTGETWWVDRSQVEFVGWPEFLLRASSVEAFDAEATPIRARPLDTAPILSTARAALPPIAVQGEWLKVTTGHLADRMPPEGWIRWRRGDRLLVVYSPLS